MGKIFYIGFIIFLFINIKLIFVDLKERKILNQFLIVLILLLPFWYFYQIYLGISIVEYLNINILAPLITLLICFELWYFWIWWAGDSKYFFILSLYILKIWTLAFVFNTGIITLLYISLYFISFWTIRFVHKKERDITLKEIKETIQTFTKSIYSLIEESRFMLFIYITSFFAFFTGMRIIKWFFLNEEIISNTLSTEINLSIENEKVFMIGAIIYFLILLFWKLLRNIYYSVWQSLKISQKRRKEFLLFIILVSFLGFIFYEYFINPEQTLKELKVIFTYYIFLFFWTKLCIYIYKISFISSDTYEKQVSDITIGDIIDYTPLLKKLREENATIDIDKMNVHGISEEFFYRDLQNTLHWLRWSIKEEQIEKVKQIYYCLWVRKAYVFRVFSYSPFIFSWFVISLIYWNKPLYYVLELISNI